MQPGAAGDDGNEKPHKKGKEIMLEHENDIVKSKKEKILNDRDKGKLRYSLVSIEL